MSSIADSLHSNAFLQLGLGNDTSGDLGYGVGLNLSRLCNSTNGGNSVQTSTSGILGSGSSNNADSQSNAEIFQRLSQMLENSADLNSLTGESTSKRNYQGKISL
jgi:hypothetical protein